MRGTKFSWAKEKCAEVESVQGDECMCVHVVYKRTGSPPSHVNRSCISLRGSLQPHWQTGQHRHFEQEPRPHLPPRQQCGICVPGLAVSSTIRVLSCRALQNPGISGRHVCPFADVVGPTSAFFAFFFGAIVASDAGDWGTKDQMCDLVRLGRLAES